MASGFPGNLVEAQRAGITITALMDASDSNLRISPDDRELMRRLIVVLIFITLFTAVFSHLYRIYAKKFYDLTGRAKWIWAPHRINRNEPVVFWATRDFTLPEQRRYTQIKVLGDPEYVLYFNGQEVGGRRVREDRHLDFFDVSPSARTGRNRIVVAVRSVSGVGGLIAARQAARSPRWSLEILRPVSGTSSRSNRDRWSRPSRG
jgi:hypothetical protein